MFTLNCKGRLLSLEKPVVMGILNITPDSFFRGSRQQLSGQVIYQAGRMLADGAAILDIGAQSTRPGSEWLDAETEWGRLSGVLQPLCQKFPEAIISVDTFHHQVALQAVKAGASIINDISAGKLDKEMLATVASLNVPFVCMHMKGTPQTMQTFADYENILAELLDYFIERIDAAKSAGIKDLVIDPGFGFAKTTEHNFELLAKMDQLKILGHPLLLGISRKSTISKTLKVSTEDSLNGTTVLHTIGLMKGASILRVHDVKEACEAIELVENTIKKASNP
jgi:dihydropteroate synthase